MDKTNRLNVLYILLVLKNYSSEQKPLSISDIARMVNKQFYDSTCNEDAAINNSTVTRILDTLYADTQLGFRIEGMDFFNDPANLGFNLYCVMKGENNTWKTYEAPEQGKGPKKFYYYESIFSDKELITLINSVEAYNYFSTDDIAGLVAKLLSMRPISPVLKKYHTSGEPTLNYEDSLVLPNIDEFSHIIKNQQFAQITYCNYNHEHKLIKRDGYPRTIRPLSMIWSNGYYYLVALLKPGYTPANLRIDRITEIKAIDPTPQMRKDFDTSMNLDVSDYRMKHPVMYGGKVQHITMLYFDSRYNSMSNAVTDTFGKTANIRPATPEEIQEHLPTVDLNNIENGTWLRVDFNATIQGTELFATQYSRYCKVISPDELKKKVKENLQVGIQLYT